MKWLWANISKLGPILTVVLLVFVYCQLQQNIANNKSVIANNRSVIRGQLYEAEDKEFAEEIAPGSEKLGTIWTVLPPETGIQDRSAKLLQLVTSDAVAFNAKSPNELNDAIYGLSAFTDAHREKTNDLRRLFLHTQSVFFHLQRAFDYKKEHILDEGEWNTWKGIIHDAHAHPILLTVIWQAYQSNYISQHFAKFLQSELCPERDPDKNDVRDLERFKRDREFVCHFYRDMTREDWPDSLPTYLGTDRARVATYKCGAPPAECPPDH